MPSNYSSDTYTLFLSILILNSQCEGAANEVIDIWYIAVIKLLYATYYMFVNCTCKLYANNGVKLSHGEISSNYLQVMTKIPFRGYQIDAALFLLE